ncbi:hypothetical protein GCM10009127_01690 [Alteraurantiacibacter aestuarii]|uniref:Uncharacterized protein n=1 Tax=Alteraurantiacibacter aestuarii TaxID=650004 RepID=A0A844ZND4_9SPHN|nr:hypothetical protein [Alteraurantiacibacter aestuarii]MXO88576.1 hypothetical protein [Alteraurantiacibacter aestuarii]
MGVAIIFLLGIANFTMHRAVLESGHAMVRSIAAPGSVFGPRVTLALEFALLLAAMLLVGNGMALWGWAYALYTAGNGLAAWLILSRRI